MYVRQSYHSKCTTDMLWILIYKTPTHSDFRFDRTYVLRSLSYFRTWTNNLHGGLVLSRWFPSWYKVPDYAPAAVTDSPNFRHLATIRNRNNMRDVEQGNIICQVSSIPADAFTSFVEFLSKQGLRRVRGLLVKREDNYARSRSVNIVARLLLRGGITGKSSQIIGHHSLHANKRSLLIKFKFYIISPLPI